MAKLGIIVPYRDREKQLDYFIPYMAAYLEEKEIHDYEIIIVEQSPEKEFNRGSLLNIGFLEAESLGCDYVAFHDLDMLPVEADYSYPDRVVQLAQHFLPRSKDQGIPYDYFGGVTLFPVDLFRSINGYSNSYWGWGFEDNDLLLRCQEKKICLSEIWFDQPKTFGKAIQFNGKDSYLEFKRPVTFNRSVLFYVDFIIDDLPVDTKRGHDEASIFSIPGLDITLAYDSFGTYKFELFDTYENVYSIHTGKMPKMHCQVIVYYDKSKHEVRFYLNSNLVGIKPLQKGRKIKVNSNRMYLGIADPNRSESKKALQGKIFTFITLDRCSEEQLEEVLAKGFAEIQPEDTTLWYDMRDGNSVTVIGEGEELKVSTVRDSSRHCDAVAVNCTLVSVSARSKYRETAPFRREGTYRLLPHQHNGSTSKGYWHSWSTRMNQKRFYDATVEGTARCKDGLTTVRRYFSWKVEDKNKVKFIKAQSK